MSISTLFQGFPGGSDGQKYAWNVGDLGSTPRSGRSPGEWNGCSLQYSCLRNPMAQEPGRLQSTGSQRIRQTEPQTHLKSCYCRKWPQGGSISSCPTYILYNLIFIVVVQPLNCVQFFATPWNAAHQASLSITKSQSLHKLMSIELVMLFNHLAAFSSCPQSGSFPMSQLFSSDAKILELQYQSFQ